MFVGELETFLRAAAHAVTHTQTRTLAQKATHYTAVHAGVYKPGLKCSTVPINLK